MEMSFDIENSPERRLLILVSLFDICIIIHSGSYQVSLEFEGFYSCMYSDAALIYFYIFSSTLDNQVLSTMYQFKDKLLARQVEMQELIR